jgi:CTP:molybdopterin cytidylyltransferase MocA
MKSGTPPRLPVIILAAGFSSRFGRPKALARRGAVSLLRRTLSCLEPLAAEKIVIVIPRTLARYRTEARDHRVCWAINRRRSEGLSSSVRRGLKEVRYAPAVLLLPVDLASLRQREVARLVSRWRGARRRVIATQVLGPDGTAQGGIPLILPRWLHSRAHALSGDTGLRALINALGPGLRILLSLPSAANDVDRPGDLRRVKLRR